MRWRPGVPGLLSRFMTRRRWIIIAVISAIVLASVFFLVLRQPGEPSYNGRRLSDWVEDISPTVLTRTGPMAIWWNPPSKVVNRGGRMVTVQVGGGGIPMFVAGPFDRRYRYPTQHIAAAKAIREIDTNAVPYLLPAIYSRDPPWVTRLVTLWRKQKWVKLPFKTAIEKQEHALPALRELGSAVVWTWVEILTNQSVTVEVQQYAAGSLAEMRQGAVPALATLLELQDHTNRSMRASIGAAIQYCDSDGFLSSLYNLRHAPNPDVRASAAWSLGFICKNPDMSIPTLARAVKDPSPQVRASALEALSKFGADALNTTNVVVHALDDPERRVRRAATNALNRIVTTDVRKWHF
jgi:hypothetical protein